MGSVLAGKPPDSDAGQSNRHKDQGGDQDSFGSVAPHSSEIAAGGANSKGGQPGPIPPLRPEQRWNKGGKQVRVRLHLGAAMTDLARLGIVITSEQAELAEDRLDGMAQAADRAENATDKLAVAARRANGAAGTMNVAMRQQGAVLASARGAMGLTAAEGLNLSRQFADVGVSVASGMPIWMVAIQQGAQIGDTFQTAAQRGVGFRMVLDSIYLRLAPLIAALGGAAIAAGAIGSVFALAARDVNRGSAGMASDLALTEEQMKRLKDSGTDMGVTMGDVFRGLGTTIKEVMGEAFGPQIDQAKSSWSRFLDELGSNTMNELRAIVGFFTGAYGAVTATWSMLPAALGDAVYTSARAVVGALQFLIDRSVGAINALRQSYNTLPEWMRGGHTAPTMTAPTLGLPENRYAGAMSAVGAAGQAGFNDDQARGESWVNDTADRVRGNAQDSRGARLRDAAGDPSDTAAGRAAKAARDLVEAMDPIQRVTLEPLRGQFQKVYDILDQTAREVALVNGLTQEMASGLASAFGRPGAALGDMLTTMTAFHERMNAIAIDRRDNLLNDQQAERARAMAQVQNYGDMLGAAKGFFSEGSAGYQALQAAEQAYRVYQFAMMIQSMVMGGQETAATVGQNLIKAASHGVVAVARALASLPFPFNLAAGAATVAALAAVGVRLFGGSGGGAGSGGTYNPAPINSRESSVATARSQASSAQRSSEAGQAGAIKTPITFDMRGAVVTADLLKQMQQMAASSGQVAVKVARQMVPADRSRSDRFALGIPAR